MKLTQRQKKQKQERAEFEVQYGKTEEFDIGQRVRINDPGKVCHDELGTVVNLDSYTIEVRLDRVTKQMMGYEDTRRGLINVYAINLVKL